MSQKNIVITGGNRGIGLELIRLYRDQGDHVVVCCRQSSAELDGLGAQVITDVDVTQTESLLNAQRQIENLSIDLLINNAGLLTQESIDEFDLAAIERIQRQFEINTLGPLKVTATFLKQLSAGAKIAMITSRMGSIEDNTSGSRYGYRMSKSALNMATKSLSIDLKERDIAVGLYHPGWVQTGMTGFTGHSSPVEAATLLKQRIEALSMENSGVFFHANGEQLPW
ncbi:short-chain dehydrogenase [Candidatus Marinamargulisbacteria bacterium SCGC AG-343-D04]|nr:short-chain dehydrogenase [Candidatus Marinamargulisbacteria bacterium SCGC AG-343-D04]